MRNFLTAILIVASSSFAISQSNLDQSFPVLRSNDSLVRVGITQIKNEHYRKAKRTLKKAVRKAVINPAGSYYLGIAEQNMYRSNHPKQKYTLQAFTDAISSDYLNPKYFWRRGIVYCGKFEFRLALVDFDRAISLNPGIPEYYLYRGNCLIESTLYDSALYSLAKCALADFNKFDSLSKGDTLVTDLLRWNYYYKAVAYKMIGQDSLAQIAHTEFERLDQAPTVDSYDAAIGLFPVGICRMDSRIFTRKKSRCD